MTASPATAPPTCDLIEAAPALFAGVTALPAAVGATATRGVEVEATVIIEEVEEATPEVEGTETVAEVDDVELLIDEVEGAVEVEFAAVTVAKAATCEVTTFPALQGAFVINVYRKAREEISYAALALAWN